MGCWLDVLLVECIRIVSSLFNTSKKLAVISVLRDEMFPLTKKAKNPDFAEFLAFWGLFGIGFVNLSQKDPSFGKSGHVINPLVVIGGPKCRY